MDDHDHGDHEHDHDQGHDHGRDHGHSAGSEDEPGEELRDVSAWLASSQKLNCPACGALGALALGGGIFCPTCGEVTTNPGYQAPAPAPEPESGPG